MNLQRHIWEGWRVQDFIDELEDTVTMIMNGQSWKAKFQTKDELKVWLKDNQPYYKKDIKEVIEYFATKHDLK